MCAAMQTAASPLMSMPGHIDPVPVPRAVTPRADGRIDLMGLSRHQIGAALDEAGLDVKQAETSDRRAALPLASIIAARPISSA